MQDDFQFYEGDPDETMHSIVEFYFVTDSGDRYIATQRCEVAVHADGSTTVVKKTVLMLRKLKDDGLDS